MLDNLMGYVNEWGPKVAMALLILVVAYIVAMIVKWAIGKAIDATGLAKKANATASSGQKTLGASLAGAGFWIVMLFGIVQALVQLDATMISEPLMNVLDTIMAYVPKIIGAVIVFGLFMIIANVVKQALGSILELSNGLPEKAGLASGPVNVSGIVSNVAFGFLAIVGAITAIDVLDVAAIEEATTPLLNSFLGMIDNIFAAGIITGIFVLIARFVGKMIDSTLPSSGLDSAIADMGILKGADGGMKASTVVSRVSTFFIILVGLVAAVKALGIETLTGQMEVILNMGAQIVFGAVIIFAGAFIANMVAGAMKSAGGDATDAAADIMKWAIIIFTTILGISRMGLDPTGGTFILDVAKYAVMGTAAAAALAFGWGGKDWAAAQLERFKSTK